MTRIYAQGGPSDDRHERHFNEAFTLVFAPGIRVSHAWHGNGRLNICLDVPSIEFVTFTVTHGVNAGIGQVHCAQASEDEVRRRLTVPEAWQDKDVDEDGGHIEEVVVPPMAGNDAPPRVPTPEEVRRRLGFPKPLRIVDETQDPDAAT